jgi:hypothetical protein
MSDDPGDDRFRLLRDLLARMLEQSEQRAHAARPQYRPLRWRRRREAHRVYMRFAAPGYPRCTS